jgi:hypothetical protein
VSGLLARALRKGKGYTQRRAKDSSNTRSMFRSTL